MALPSLEPSSETDLSRDDAVDLLARQTEVLGMIVSGNNLRTTLAAILRSLEHLMPGARCSILLFRPDTATLHHGAAPSLPEAYTHAIDGMSIGPSAGSCGTAAYLGSGVIAEDIENDERWDDFRAFALPHQLRSCWSTPIRGRSGITGTFAVYHDAPHRPTDRENLLVDRFTHLASVVIDQSRLIGALTESEEHFRHAFEDNAIGMALVGLDGTLVRVNRALREMLRRSESELLATPLDTLITPVAPLPKGQALFEDLVTGGQDRVHVSATTRASTGRLIQLSVDAAVVRDSEGRPAHLGVNLLDVTHRRAMDAERRARREAEVARRIAESASRNKSEFVAAMSHDIRTPLQSIVGLTEMLRTKDLTPERRTTALEHIARAASHITELVDDVLDIALIEAGSLPLKLTTVPVDHVVREVLDITGSLAESRQVSMEATRTTVSVRADARRLRQVLLNLVSNAIAYNHPQGSVRIDVSPGADQVEIRISNTGQGIPADKLDRLFVPFDRLGAEEQGEPGVGLGLSLALGLTEAMGGSLAVDSEPGSGTTVLVRLTKVAP